MAFDATKLVKGDPERVMRFKNQVVAVTGGAGGLGWETARMMAREGAKIALVDIANGEPLALELRNNGGQAQFFHGDLSSSERVHEITNGIISSFGQIDVLVNCAGGGVVPRAADDQIIDLQQWKSLIDINLTSTMLCCNSVAPHMISRRFGKIVNVSSRSARSTGWFSAVATGYVCAKIAVLGLTRDLATKLGPNGINVNCVLPAFVVSGDKMQKRWNEIAEEEKKKMIAATPLRRLPRVEEIVSAILFLASSDASYVTGVSLDVNGGSFMS